MATPAQPQPASSDSEPELGPIERLLQPRPQVFVNFRGNELRNGFVSHVVKALRDVGINVFIDSLEMRGVETLEHLLERIDKSQMALAIFSDRYTESDWCLNELVRMHDRMKEGKLVVIPIFYRVSTEDVKRFQGKFGRRFRETVMSKFGTDEAPMAQRWMIAVTSIASITGLTSDVHSIDSKLVEEIVKASMRQLDHFSSANLSILGELAVEFFVALFIFIFRIILNPFGKVGESSSNELVDLMLLFVVRKSFYWLLS